MQVCEFQSCQRFEKVYIGSRNNFNWTKFHAICDNISPTLVIVKSNEECIFGGYTKVKWNQTEGWVADFEAFLFRLKTSSLGAKKYPVKNEKAIYCSESFGPFFGPFDLDFNDEGHVLTTLNSDISNSSALSISYYGVPFKYRKLKLSELTEVEVFQEIKIEAF